MLESGKNRYCFFLKVPRHSLPGTNFNRIYYGASHSEKERK